jgi:hypothetical protein
VNVLDNIVTAVRPGGVILDLQVIRPNPRVELAGVLICEIDGESLLEQADAATAAVDTLIRSGRLTDEATDDHDVRKHYPNGSDLVDDFEGKKRRIPESAMPRLRAIRESLVVRERCRLRRLGVL